MKLKDDDKRKIEAIIKDREEAHNYYSSNSPVYRGCVTNFGGRQKTIFTSHAADLPDSV